MEQQLPMEPRAALLSLPPTLHGNVVGCFLPAAALDSPQSVWQPILRCMTTSSQFLDSLGQTLCELLQLRVTAAGLHGWPHALRSLMVGGCPRCNAWEKLRPLCAVRPGTPISTPLQAAPRLSGASLVACGSHLIIYGGRCASGETADATYLVQASDLPAGLAKWDQLLCEGVRPAPRCYHGAVKLGHDSSGSFSMLIFGGAGDGDVLHNDAWSLELCIKRDRLHGSQSCRGAAWKQIQQRSALAVPTARSSFVFATWQRGGCAVLHGGLGSNGVRSDVWVFSAEGIWRELLTNGAPIARAHHCGAVHSDCLLVYSGQDETFLTAHTVHSLDLSDGVWHEIRYHKGPSSRIDAVAAAVDSIGILIFGGVGATFEFEPMDTWLLKGVRDFGQAHVVNSSASSGLRPRPSACSSLSVQGMHVYMYGGFDGQADLDELWRMDMMPCSLQRQASTRES
eukprot:TRINITY_DN8093_c0_g1_i1.p1 TRINITY_DN8093_c0_g1~~TRINITY_DN8093_c0_g1_i1.p1  ORF type:complete len:463 (+),score=81.99 TRINITY_DN8093_c0_g1_i1:30-1391(+)